MKTEDKKEFQIIQTCTGFKILFENRLIESKEEISEVLEYIFPKLLEHVTEQQKLLEIIQLFQPDEVKYDDKSCETCGNTMFMEKYLI